MTSTLGSGALRQPPDSSLDAERLRAVLSRAVARVCPAELHSHREDIVQNAVVRVLELQRRESKSGSKEEILARPASYLWRVAYTTALDELRRFQRRREMKTQDDQVPEREAPAFRPELKLALRGCLELLAPARRQAVALHLHGFSAEEGARTTRWTVKRVQNLVFRGLQDLRRCLEEKGVAP